MCDTNTLKNVVLSPDADVHKKLSFWSDESLRNDISIPDVAWVSQD